MKIADAFGAVPSLPAMPSLPSLPSIPSPAGLLSKAGLPSGLLPGAKGATKDWRKQLRPASFRGVPFGVQHADTTIGRRVVVHEYPQRDEAFPEDMGGRPREFSIEAIVLGDDYMTRRDALMEALEKRGAGTLIHPYYGSLVVTLVGPVRVTETPDEGGCARFTLDFIRAGEDKEPSARQDTRVAVQKAADRARLAIAADFVKKFSLAGVASFVSGSALGLAGKIVGALNSARGLFVPAMSALSDVVFAANRITSSLGSLLRAPAAFAQAVMGMVGQLKVMASEPKYAMASYRSLFKYGADIPKPATTTPSRRREAENQVAMTALVRRAAMVDAAETASLITFDSFEAAVAARDELASVLDAESVGELSDGSVIEVADEVHQAMVDLRAALIKDITARSIDAPRLTTTMLPSTMPAVVAAYEIWGDATRADELVTRNAGMIPHPGFVPGGRPLEIVID